MPAGRSSAFERIALDADVVAPDPAVAVGRGEFGHLARVDAVFVDRDLPLRAVHAGGENIGDDYVCAEVVAVNGFVAAENSVAAVEADLIVACTLRAFEIGIGDVRAVEFVDHVTVRRTVAAARRPPEITAGAAVNPLQQVVFGDRAGLEVVRMGGQEVYGREFGKHRQYAVVVAIVGIVTQRDVVAEHHGHGFLDIAQVGFEPGNLLVGKTSDIGVVFREDDVVHAHEMDFSAVERKMGRSQHAAERLSGIVDCAFVVVADNGVDQKRDCAQLAFHQIEIAGVPLADDVAQGHADNGALLSLQKACDVVDGLVAETGDLLLVVGLWVADAQQDEARVVVRHAAERKICAVRRRCAACNGFRGSVESRIVAVVGPCGRNFITRRN